MDESAKDNPQSEREGGRDFEQALLYAEDIAKARAGDLSRRMARQQNQLKVLMVDDEPSLRLLVSTTLAGEGYEIKQAETGEEALSIAEEFLPGLVLLDVNLPGINGFEVCKRLREDDRFRETRVVMLTAEGRLDQRDEGMTSGADAYLVKPFRPMELLATVERVVKLPRKG